jgi:hypothetical protein
MNLKVNAVMIALGILGPAIPVYAIYTDNCVVGTTAACKYPGTNCTWENQEAPGAGGYTTGCGTCQQVKSSNQGGSNVCKCR